MLTSSITGNKRQKALLLYQADQIIQETFPQLPEMEEEDDFDLVKQKSTDYFKPQKKKRYEVHRFR